MPGTLGAALHAPAAHTDSGMSHRRSCRSPALGPWRDERTRAAGGRWSCAPGRSGRRCGQELAGLLQHRLQLGLPLLRTPAHTGGMATRSALGKRRRGASGQPSSLLPTSRRAATAASSSARLRRSACKAATSAAICSGFASLPVYLRSPRARAHKRAHTGAGSAREGANELAGQGPQGVGTGANARTGQRTRSAAWRGRRPESSPARPAARRPPPPCWTRYGQGERRQERGAERG